MFSTPGREYGPCVEGRGEVPAVRSWHRPRCQQAGGVAPGPSDVLLQILQTAESQESSTMGKLVGNPNTRGSPLARCTDSSWVRLQAQCCGDKALSLSYHCSYFSAKNIQISVLTAYF